MRASVVVVLLLLSLLAIPRGARANMAEAVTAGDRFGALVPRGATGVRVERETLSFDLDASLASAKVRAVYRMIGGAEASSSEVAFVLVEGRGDRGPEAAITIDGAPVTFRVVRADDASTPPAEVAAMTRAWSTLGASSKLAWLVFRLDFTPSQAREVTVAYTHVPTEDRAARVNSTFGYDYLLSPAKAWASFGPIEISVRAPADVTLTSNVALARRGDAYRATLPGLPAGELSFAVMSTRGLWLGMTTSGGYWVIVIALMIATALAAGTATGGLFHTGSALRRGALRVVIGGGLSVAAAIAMAAALSAALPRHGLGFGYGGFFGVALLVMLAFPLGIAASYRAAARRKSSF